MECDLIFYDKCVKNVDFFWKTEYDRYKMMNIMHFHLCIFMDGNLIKMCEVFGMKKKVLICMGILCIGCILASCGKKKGDSEAAGSIAEESSELSEDLTEKDGFSDTDISPDTTEAEAEEAVVPDMPADFTMEGIYRTSGVILDGTTFTMDQMVNDFGISYDLLDMGLQFNGDGTGVSVASGISQNIGYQPMEGPNGRYVILSMGSEQKAVELTDNGTLHLSFAEEEVESTGAYAESSMILVFSASDVLPEVSAGSDILDDAVPEGSGDVTVVE